MSVRKPIGISANEMVNPSNSAMEKQYNALLLHGSPEKSPGKVSILEKSPSKISTKVTSHHKNVEEMTTPNKR